MNAAEEWTCRVQMFNVVMFWRLLLASSVLVLTASLLRSIFGPKLLEEHSPAFLSSYNDALLRFQWPVMASGLQTLTCISQITLLRLLLPCIFLPESAGHRAFLFLQFSLKAASSPNIQLCEPSWDGASRPGPSRPVPLTLHQTPGELLMETRVFLTALQLQTVNATLGWERPGEA